MIGAKEMENTDFDRLILDADNGNAEAQLKAGDIFNYGDGVTQNYEKAFEYYSAAAEQNNAEAQFNIGYFYYVENYPEQNLAEAFKYFKSAAELGDKNAMYFLGLMFLRGHATEPNEQAAFNWILKASEADNDIAQLELSGFYEDGIGTDVDQGKAIYWLKKSAENGYDVAQDTLGLYYCKGNIVSQDYHEAKSWYEKAAENGYTNSMYNLSIMYSRGEGVPEDQEKAFEWLLKAAQAGDVECQIRVGQRYQEGRGTDQDYEKAKYWYELAAKENNAEAICELGLLYWRGLGVEKNRALGNQYMKKAAELGSLAAMHNIALSLLEGDGIPQNTDEGMMWLRKAAENNHPESCGALYRRLKDVNPEEALQWLKKAALLGSEPELELLISILAVEDARTNGENSDEYNYWLDVGIKYGCMTAYVNMGKRLMLGNGVQADFSKGLQYIQYAIAGGSKSAKTYLADLYLTGYPPYIDKNVDKAISLYIQVVNSEAEDDCYVGEGHYKLGQLYISSCYGIQDTNKGIKLLEQAADYGYILASHDLAVIYSDNKLLSRNIEKAVSYANRFKENGGDKQTYDTLLEMINSPGSDSPRDEIDPNKEGKDTEKKQFKWKECTIVLLTVGVIICIILIFAMKSRIDELADANTEVNSIENDKQADDVLLDNNTNGSQVDNETINNTFVNDNSGLYELLGKSRTDIEQIYGESYDVRYDDMNIDEIIASYDTDAFYGLDAAISVFYYNDHEDNHDNQYAFEVSWYCEGESASFEKYQEILNSMEESFGEADEVTQDDSYGLYNFYIWRSDEEYGGSNSRLEEKGLKIAAIRYNDPAESTEDNQTIIQAIFSNTEDI